MSLEKPIQGIRYKIVKRGYANLAAATNYYVTWDCATTWGGAGEAAAQIAIPFNGVCKEFRVKCSFNAGTVSSVFTVRQNNGATSMTVTVTNGSTAQFTDSSHPFTVASGDLITIERLTPGGTGTIDANYTLIYEVNA